MSKSNPFAVSMATLVVPAHMGSSLNVGGFEIEAGPDGTVDVPQAHVETLLAHGLQLPAVVVEPAPAQRANQAPGQRVGIVK